MNKHIHGESQVYWYGPVLVIKPSGTFNMDGVKDVAMKVKSCIENKPSGNWVRFYIFDDKATLGPMESLPFLAESLKKSKEIGCVGIVTSGGSPLNIKGLQIICEQAELPLHCASSFDEGIVIAEQLSA